jgi:hypothetical protein
MLATHLEDCQADSLEAASTKVPRVRDLGRRALEQFRRAGAAGTIRKVCSFLLRVPASRKASVSAAQSGKAPVADEVLGLQPGELVEVKSLDEILATLDSNGKLHGLAFLHGMHPFSGKRFVVFKRMATLYSEETGQVRTLKNTVLLTGVQCDGLLMRCDRSCYFYWREAWLRRVESSESVPKSAPAATRA